MKTRACKNEIGVDFTFAFFKMLLVFSPLITSGQSNTFPSTGNVGIGTTSPQRQLEVVGNGYFSNEVFSVGRFRVNSTNEDTINHAPWYGFGYSNLKLDDHEAVQLVVFLGVNMQTEGG